MKNFKHIAITLSFFVCATPQAQASKRSFAFATFAIPASITAWYNQITQTARPTQTTRPKNAIFPIRKFNPVNKEQTTGILNLMQQNESALFDPNEKALDALIKYKNALILNNQEIFKDLHVDIVTCDNNSNDVLGYIAYQLPTNHITTIYTMAIKKDIQRQGIGLSLIKNAEKKSLNANNKMILLVIYSDNSNMISLVQKAGYNQLSKIYPASHLDNNGNPVHTLIYIKNL